MKAIILNGYGGPEKLILEEIEKPVPKVNEILIKVKAVHINYGDLLARNFKEVTPDKMNMPMLFWFFAKLYFGFSKPKIKILGSEFAGVVESVGKDVKSFKAGDKVFGYLGQKMGAYAEYVCVKETDCVIAMPSNLDFEAASAVPYGSIMALHMMRGVGIKPGQKVLINGASGSLGSAAVQIAKHYGAEVTGVCGTERVEYVKSLGADFVIDYSKEDFTRNGKSYNVIYDVLRKTSFDRCIGSLNNNGILLFASFKTNQLFQAISTSLFKRKDGKRVICTLAPGSRDDLKTVRELVEKGSLISVTDNVYPAEKIAEAHKLIESGKRKGNVVITF